jgi:hypothetical protein
MWYVKKSFISESGKKLKTARILCENFITNDRHTILNLCFGKIPGLKMFSVYWDAIKNPNFIHDDKIEKILSKFKHYLDSANKPYPDIVINDYPEIFKYE